MLKIQTVTGDNHGEIELVHIYVAHSYIKFCVFLWRLC